MRKFVLFYNPVSGSAAFKGKLDMMVEAFQRRGALLIPYRTKAGGNEGLIDFVREVLPQGIIAAGGDGTVHEAANLIMKGRLNLPLGIIGSGTSNDFATYLGINEDLEGYFDIIVEGRTRRCDLGLVSGIRHMGFSSSTGSGTRHVDMKTVSEEYFINVASAGMMTSIAHDVAPSLKNALGKNAYYLKGLGELTKFHSWKLRVEADDQEHEVEAYLFVIINSPTVGSMKHVADGVQVDDGLLDFLAVQKNGVPQLMALGRDLIAGKSVSERDGVLHLQARRFTVLAEEELQSDLDGEAGPMLPLTVETVCKAIEVYC